MAWSRKRHVQTSSSDVGPAPSNKTDQVLDAYSKYMLVRRVPQIRTWTSTTSERGIFKPTKLRPAGGGARERSRWRQPGGAAAAYCSADGGARRSVRGIETVSERSLQSRARPSRRLQMDAAVSPCPVSSDALEAVADRVSCTE
jgi:hypothetical protein